MKSKILFILETIANALIIGGFLLLSLAIWPTLSSEVWYWAKKSERAYKCKFWKVDCTEDPDSLFAPLANSPTPLKVIPASKKFGIVIESLGVNAPIVENVPTNNKELYMEAMRRGIAHAQGTSFPGEEGNTYLFAHSSLDFWRLGKYATVFNLLRKIEEGDRITVFYKGKRYDYTVKNKSIISRFNTKPLTQKVEGQQLTMQTCYPPGTTLKRLIVTAKPITTPSTSLHSL